MSDDSIAKAQRHATVARKRLLATVHEIQARLAPAHVFEEVKADVVAKSRDVAQSAGATVRERPGAMGAAAAAGALLVLHRPLIRFVLRPFRRTAERDQSAAN